MVKPHGHLVPVSFTPYGASTPGLSTSSSTRGLQGPCGPGDALSRGWLPAYMLSAVILSAHSYPAVRLAPQPDHQRCVHPGPLVLGTAPLKHPAPTADRDRTVSRRSEPSSRATLIGEQPNPCD